MNRFNVFEKDVVENILKSYDDSFGFKILEQYKCCTVTKRVLTGVGFFTSFQVGDLSMSLGKDINLRLGGIGAKIKGLKDEHAGFVLYIENGILTELEGYSYGGDRWPKKITDYTLYLINKDGSLTDL